MRTALESYRRIGNAAQWYFFLCHGIREGLSLAVSYLWFIWQCIWRERQLSQTLCFISAKRGYRMDQVLEDSISLPLVYQFTSLSIHLPGCSSALGPDTMTAVIALNLNSFVLSSYSITGGRICLYPFPCLYSE